MYRQNEHLTGLLQPVVERLGYELLGIEQHSRGKEILLRLYIDNETGIRLDDCARVSDQVTGVLDVNDPVSGSYVLEVSSPGLDRPFFTIEQMSRYCGHQVKLVLNQKQDGRRKIIGEIRSVDEKEVIILIDGNEYHILPSNIDKARLVPD